MSGVNNHGQTIVLACAFLSKEKTESSIWMFEGFKKVMPGGEPKMIIIDQDVAMARAISIAFPTTFHRLCIRHITSKFSAKLPHSAYKEYWLNFQKTIWDTGNKDEFDAKWNVVVTKFGLIDHPWLSSVFDLRESWVPAYVQHVFATGMSSSQRVEGSHAFFKQYTSRRNSLMDFITRFERALSHQRQKELLADHIDAFEMPQCALPMPMNKQMATLYIRAMFQKFDLRESWVPAYVQHVFSTGMSRSERAEDSHAFFKQCTSRRNSLMDFIRRFERDFPIVGVFFGRKAYLGFVASFLS